MREEHPGHSRFGRVYRRSDRAFGRLPGELAGLESHFASADGCEENDEELETSREGPEASGQGFGSGDDEEIGSDSENEEHSLRILKSEKGGAEDSASLVETLAIWKRRHSVGRAAMEELLAVIRKHFAAVVPTVRSLDRMLAPKVGTITREEWIADGLAEEDFDLSHPMFSVWRWIQFILHSRQLRESLVANRRDRRMQEDIASSAEMFRSVAFREMLELADPAIDYPLFLMLYFDEFQPFRFSSLKVGAVYFTLGNFPSHVRASVQNHFLLRLFPAEKMDCFWIAVKHVVSQTKSVRTLNLEGMAVSVKLYIGAFIGDMPVRNRVSSVASPGNEYPCARCRASKGNLLEIRERRSKEDSLSKALNPLEGTDMRRQCSGDSVLRRELQGLILDDVLVNPLFDAPSFDPHRDVCVDIMHDEFLGVAAFELVECMRMISPSLRSVFLARLSSKRVWPRGIPRVRNMKAALSNASSVRALMIVAPIAFASLVSAECLRSILSHSLIVRDLLEMTDEDSRSDSFMVNLEERIKDHTRMLVDLYPSLAQRPKLHIRLHYVEHARRFGPPHGSSSSRFEGKHQVFKRRMVRGGQRGLAFRTASQHEALLQTIRPGYSDPFEPPVPCEVSEVPFRMLSSGDPMYERTRACAEGGFIPGQSLWVWNTFHHMGNQVREGDDVTLRVGGVDRTAVFHHLAGYGRKQHSSWTYFIWVSYWRETGSTDPDLGWAILSQIDEHRCVPLKCLVGRSHVAAAFLRKTSISGEKAYVCNKCFYPMALQVL